MLKTMTAIAGLLLAQASGQAFSATYTIDFDSGFTNEDTIPQSYGDNVDANISYREIIAGFGDVASGAGELRYWDTGAGDLQDVAYASTPGNHGEIKIEATGANMLVTLNSFDFGGFGATDRSASWSVFDGDYNLLDSGNGIAPATGSHLSFAPGVSSDILILQWGDNAYLTAIDNISYDVVPIPAALPLLISGLLGASLIGWKRRPLPK